RDDGHRYRSRSSPRILWPLLAVSGPDLDGPGKRQFPLLYRAWQPMRIPWASPRAILDENCRCARGGVQECELPGFAMPPGNARFDPPFFAMPSGNIPGPSLASTELGCPGRPLL